MSFGKVALKTLLLDSLTQSAAYNATIVRGEKGAWVLAYCGPIGERDRLTSAIRGLGPVSPFVGSDRATVADMLAQSEAAAQPVLGEALVGEAGTVVGGYFGAIGKARELEEAVSTSGLGTLLRATGRGRDFGPPLGE